MRVYQRHQCRIGQEPIDVGAPLERQIAAAPHLTPERLDALLSRRNRALPRLTTLIDPAKFADFERLFRDSEPARPLTLHAQLCATLKGAADRDTARQGAFAVRAYLADHCDVVETPEAVRIVTRDVCADLTAAQLAAHLPRACGGDVVAAIERAVTQLRPGKRLEIMAASACEPVAATA